MTFRLQKSISNFSYSPTFANDNAFRGVRAEAVGGDALVLAGVGRHRVHDLDRDDAVRVRDRILVRLQLLSALEPFDLRDKISLFTICALKLKCS